jgi:hypothetical protein
MYKFGNELLTKLNALDNVTVEQGYDEHEYSVTVDLGTGWAGNYTGGYWADAVTITNDNLKLHFNVLDSESGWVDEDDELDYCIGEGYVHMNYADYGSGNLAYTSELEDLINDAIQTHTNGILVADGSEQGMQGYDSEDECYLSLDLNEWCGA